jgi:hypothetical protein
MSPSPLIDSAQLGQSGKLKDASNKSDETKRVVIFSPREILQNFMLLHFCSCSPFLNTAFNRFQAIDNQCSDNIAEAIMA